MPEGEAPTLVAGWFGQLHQKQANPSCGGAYTVKKPLREMLIFIRLFDIEWVLKCFLQWRRTGISYQDHNLV